ncbi:MAG: glycosyltransferase [Candidatus Pacebacteria bacterium]|nr:glycosyltransferase [Candidatus Paceibacterota bacterium]
MKICLVSDYLVEYHPNWSGAELVCQFLASLLEKKEKVFFLTTNPKKKTAENVFVVPVLNSLGFLKKIIPLHLPVRTLAVFFHLLRIRPDVIHLFHTNSLFIPTLLAAKILKIPATFTVLDYWILCPTGHLRLQDGSICREGQGDNCKKCVSLMKLWERKLVLWLSRDLKDIITFTETSKRRMVEYGFPEEKIRVQYVYNFKMALQKREKEIYDVLFVGTFKPQKGLHIVIKAMAEVLKKIPSSRLTVVGRGMGQDQERIEELAKKEKVLDSIDFLGQKENRDVLRIVSQSKVMVVAEQWFSDFGPVALVEAMAQGRGLVSGNLGSASDFIREGQSGFLVDYDKPDQFAEKIICLLQDQGKRELMGRQAEKSIEHFFLPEHKEKIFNLYTSL